MAGGTKQAGPGRSRARVWIGAILLACAMTGCTTFREYCANGFKVGPNYARPPAAISSEWVDQADARLSLSPEEHRNWWKVFNDPVLDDLVCGAFHQNLTLREHSFRVLELEAILGSVVGRIFPQQQFMDGGYQRIGLSQQVANRELIPTRFYSQWLYGFGLAWELDIWGKYRRNIESFEAELNAGIENYDAVLVKTLGEVASAYTRYRILDTQIEFVKANVELQRETLKIAEARFRGGLVTELDVDQAVSILQQTLSLIPQLEIDQRLAQNRLCVLLGIPVEDLRTRLGRKGIPVAPPTVVLGVPAELLKRRPDVRRAEREAAARCARIGIAETEWYPAVSITGTIGYQAEYFPDLFDSRAFMGAVGPSFRWNILHYGRIANDVLRTEAIFQQAVLRYQQTVLKANEEVENAVVRFLKAQQRTRELVKSVEAAEKAVRIAIAQYKSGMVDFNRVSLLQQNLVQQQVLEASARGEIAEGLIGVYQALGGGWQIRLDGCSPSTAGLSPAAAPNEPILPDKPNLLPQPKPDPNNPVTPNAPDDKQPTVPGKGADNTAALSESVKPPSPLELPPPAGKNDDEKDSER